jgi:hypothetical protein
VFTSARGGDHNHNIASLDSVDDAETLTDSSDASKAGQLSGERLALLLWLVSQLACARIKRALDASIGNLFQHPGRGLGPFDFTPRLDHTPWKLRQTKAVSYFRMTQKPAMLDVVDAVSERRDHLRVAQYVQRLDEALVELPRQNSENRLPMSSNLYCHLVRPFQTLGQLQKSIPALGDRKLSHVSGSFIATSL